MVTFGARKSISPFCFRLCNDPQLAKEVVRLNGLGRLVELCKNERARVSSDGVLVACLAAVRKISAAVGYSHFQQVRSLSQAFSAQF